MSAPVITLPPVQATGGKVTVMRTLAAASYGNYTVEYPDNVEPAYTPEGAREDGYVATLPVATRRRIGGLGRRFIRADLNVSAKDNTTDVEEKLDLAATRTEGDIYFDTDIDETGLGRLIPYVHFTIGDWLNVLIWGLTIPGPVTKIERTITNGIPTGWSIHVGGQLISDEDARRAANADSEAKLLQEQRERIANDQVVGKAAKDAQSTAEGAQGAAEGAQKSTDDLTEDLTGDVETPVPEAVERRTGALGGVKRDVDQAQSEQIILHDNQLKWLRWTKTRFNFGFSRASGEDYNVSDTVETGLVDVLVNEFDGKGVRWIVRPGWKGTYRVEAMFEDGTESTIHGRALGQANAFSTQSDLDKTAVRASVQVWPDHGVEPREWAVQVQRSPGGQPQFITPGGLGAEDISLSGEGLISFSVPVRADHSVRHLGVYPLESGQLISRGVQVAPALNEASGVVIFTEVMPQLQWDIGIPLRGDFTGQIASRIVPWSIRLGAWNYATVGTWTAPAWDQPVRATISYSIRWAEISAWSVAEYRTRVQVNGSTVDWIGRSTVGGMNSLFRRSVDVTLRAGDRISIGAAAQDNEDRRRRMSGSFTVTWRPL